MQVTVKKLPASKMEIVITLPWEEWQGEREHAVEHLGKDVKVAGFRPGKVPRDVIEKRFGKEALLAEAVEHAVSHAYPKAISDQKIAAIGRPEVKLEKTVLGEPLVFSVITAVMPEAKLGSWRDAVKKANKLFAKPSDTVEEKDVDAELEKLASMRAKAVTVNREARLGDNVLVDFSVLQDGVLIENGKSEKHPLVLGKGVFIPGFEEQLVGMKESGEKTFDLTFPAQYHAKHLAGKPATFHVKLGVVQEREIPVIDDAFAVSLGNFTSLEKLKENLRLGMLEEKKAQYTAEHRTQILDALVEHSEMEYPEILVEEESNRMVREFEIQIQSLGQSFAMYLAQVKKTEEELKQDFVPQAKKRLAAHIILDALADEEGMEIASQDVEAEMNKTLQHYKDSKDIEKKIDMERLYSAARGQLRNEKTFLWLESL